MNEFQKVFETLNVSGENPNASSPSSKKSSPGSHGNQRIHSNVTAKKDDIDQHGYAVPRDNVVNRPWVGKLGGPGRNGAAGGVKPRDFHPKNEAGGNEYAQPIIPPNPDQSQKSKSSKHRERRKQMSMQHGKFMNHLSHFVSRDVYLLES